MKIIVLTGVFLFLGACSSKLQVSEGKGYTTSITSMSGEIVIGELLLVTDSNFVILRNGSEAISFSNKSVRRLKIDGLMAPFKAETMAFSGVISGMTFVGSASSGTIWPVFFLGLTIGSAIEMNRPKESFSGKSLIKHRDTIRKYARYPMGLQDDQYRMVMGQLSQKSSE